MDVPSMAVDMSSISVVRTAARLAPRTKPSESLWFATSWRLPLSEIFLTLLCTLNMYFQSYMPSCTTVCRAPFTPKWSGTDPARPERTGKIISVENIFKTFREINFTSFLAFINIAFTEVSWFIYFFISRTPPPRYPLKVPMNNQGQKAPGRS